MKFVRFLGFLWFLIPCVSFAASSYDFQNASQLLAAARRGDTQTVQILINNGANVNYVDSTGLSLVCTAVMNNDKRAIQVLQMYGADASQCDRQIKNYKQKTRVAARGEEYGFFSGLSSSHVLALSAVGVAAVIGGVALLTDAFDAKNNNGTSASGGSHSGGGGGGSGTSGKQWAAGSIPYGPAYLTTSGEINQNTNIAENLANWDTESNSALRVADFNYLRKILTVGNAQTSQAELDGVNPLLENYLLDMHGYHSFANGYMGQFTFRDDNSHAPELSKLNDALGSPLQGRPVRVALITGNGINPAGSADSANGIMYAVNNTTSSQTPIVDKYLNNTLTVNSSMTEYTETENTGFDLSGSGSAFNPFANVNDSALAKIVAGWEAGGRASGDLYGFVPNGQLAIYRTGNGNKWSVIEDATSQTSIGTFTDNDSDGKLSSGDVVVIDGKTYNIATALSQATASSTINIGGTVFKLSTNSTMLVGVCDTTSGCSTDIGIYIGTDGAWYVNSNGGDDIDSVYISDSGSVYDYKTKTTGAAFTNFHLMQQAVNTSDVVANTNVLPQSRQYSYLTVDNFTKAATLAGVSSDLNGYYALQITNNYGTYSYSLNGNTINEAQGTVANTMFGYYNSSNPMIVMPAGDYLFKDASTNTIYYDTLSATFENYAPMIYGNNLEHNFMTVVGVSHANGNTEATTISGYGNGTGSAYGKLQLSLWVDSNNDVYSSRKCGITGQGGSGVDPWCFAASGPTAEMATASAAGAVASVKSAFSYMSTDQIFTLLALTADGPYLNTNLNGAAFSTDNLAAYLQAMYELPLEYDVSTMSSSEYLSAFKEVFGYGLINLERAITPGYSVYYYSDGDIVSASGNAFWRNATITSSSARASTVLGSRAAIKTSFYDIVESADGALSLPRVWNTTVSLGNDSKHGLYMGDVLADFTVDSTNKHTNKIGNMTFDMAMSSRAYADNFNGLDNLKVSLNNENYDLEAGYQHYLTDGESRFSGRANGILSLVANSVSSGAKYKAGNFVFGAHAFSGTITDENLLENDPVVSAQFEPSRLGFANGGAVDVSYNNDKFGFDMSFGNMHETNTVLGSISEGLLSLNGANTQYVDAVANYKPFEKVKLSARATFANTRVNVGDGIISELSDIKSNAFALGADVYGFSFTAAMPLAAVDGHMGYDYADLNVVENNGSYEVAVNNPHIEYVDLAAQKRELRFSGSYRQPLGDFTDAGIGFIYRVNPSNTDVFGNESIFMFKLHHRLGI